MSILEILRRPTDSDPAAPTTEPAGESDPTTSAGPSVPARTDALLPVVGAGGEVPLVTGATTTYANLDYAASAPCLAAVAEKVSASLPYYASVHRGAGYNSQVSTALYESARADIGRFVDARQDDIVVITRNTTDALNLLAGAVPDGREVVCLDIEHHANLLPWLRRAARVVPAGTTQRGTLIALHAELHARPAALLAITGLSNVTGEVLPLDEIAAIAHGAGARVVVDAAQLAPHRRISLARSGVDYVAFSGHKLYAPFGAGALVGRRDWLDRAPAYLAGGGAASSVEPTEPNEPTEPGPVSPHGATRGPAPRPTHRTTPRPTHRTTPRTTWHPAPQRHEGGTPNVLGAVALAAACRVLAGLRPGELERHEAALRDRLVRGLSTLPGVELPRIWRDSSAAIGVVAFTVAGFEPGAVAAYLSAEHGIGVRDGKFCAHPLLRRLGVPDGAVRASFGAGTTSADIDRLVSAVDHLVHRGPSWTYAVVDGRWAPVPDPRAYPTWE